MQRAKAGGTCQAQASPGPGRKAPSLMGGHGGDQCIGTRVLGQCPANGVGQFQVGAAAQQRLRARIDQVTEQEQRFACQRPLPGCGIGAATEGHHVGALDHLQQHPRVIMHEQGAEGALVLLQHGAAGCGQTGHQHP